MQSDITTRNYTARLTRYTLRVTDYTSMVNSSNTASWVAKMTSKGWTKNSRKIDDLYVSITPLTHVQPLVRLTCRKTDRRARHLLTLTTSHAWT